jgi:hypothetical protein
MAHIFNSRLMILVYGFLLWLTTFLVSVVINPLKDTSVPLFDSLMPVALSALTLWFLYLYFKGVPSGYAKAGQIAGVVWLIMNILLDQLLFSWGPMQMTFTDYIYDIGLTYLLIPVITTGAGYLMDKARASSING